MIRFTSAYKKAGLPSRLNEVVALLFVGKKVI
jgi:hypothetical protein